MDEYNKYLNDEDYKKMYMALDKEKLVDMAVTHTHMLVNMSIQKENTSKLGFIFIVIIFSVGIGIGVGISKFFL